MSGKDRETERAETDASLHAERHNTDRELKRRVVVADEDADAVLGIARERADRLLLAARAAADARLPLHEQTEAAVALLLQERDEEDRSVSAERQRADERLDRERTERREKLLAQLVLERQTTDLHLSLERRGWDRAVSARDDFLAQASHDLRALMAALRIYVSLLVKETTAPPELSKLASHLAAVVTIEAQMDRLINDLVDLVAIEAGKLAVTPTVHSASDLLSTATAVYEPLTRERAQVLSAEPGPDASIQVDLTRGVQVLGNLLSNAIKFSPRGGQIRVGFETINDEVMFFVADTGPGVSTELADHIFERFVGSKGTSSGLGLGLFIAARVVEAHGGRLWFDRERAQGSVFRFTLRRA